MKDLSEHKEVQKLLEKHCDLDRSVPGQVFCRTHNVMVTEKTLAPMLFKDCLLGQIEKTEAVMKYAKGLLDDPSA